MKFLYPPTLKGRVRLIFISLGLGLSLIFLVFADIKPASAPSLLPEFGFTWQFWYVLGFAVTLGLLTGGYWLTRNIIGRYDALHQLIQKLTTGRFISLPVNPMDPLELQEVIRDLNILGQNVETQLEELRNFISNSSHELRTPLTAIKLRVESLRNKAYSDPQVAERFLEEMEMEVDRMSKMVNDLLDLTRIEAGMTYSSPVELDFAQIVQEVCASFAVRAKQSGIELTCTLNEDMPMLMGVEEHLRRIVYNLVDNAIKYTPNNGWIAVRLSSMDREKGLRLVVKDSGYGISSNDLPHIFERFYRVEATRPRYASTRGSGLGLPIVKTIVGLHGGQITAKSEIGRGSEFVVEFPAAN